MVKIKRKIKANNVDVSTKTGPKNKLLKDLTQNSPNKALALKPSAIKSPGKTTVWHTLLKEKVRSSVEALLKLKARKHSVNEILLDEHEPVFMIVQCVRIPKMQTKNFRFLLPHPIIDEESDICLFVPDLKKGRNVDHEPTVEHYKELLRANQIKGISEIIPLRQVKVEYDQFELRRQLISRFDLFLSDGRISGHIHHMLGKVLYKRRKLPVPVDMKAKNLKQEFDRAKSKVLMMMTGAGDKAALKVGHTKQKVKDIVENILEVANQLGRQYPGGWDNVLSLNIHVQDSKPIPVYISLKPRNSVEVPEVNYIKPKKAVAVEGELSTFPGTKVIVLPDGEVIVKKVKSEEDAEMGSDWDEYDSDMEIELNDEENSKVEIKKEEDTPEIKQEQSSNDESDSESEEKVKEEEEDDEVEENIVENAEMAYLNEWHKERISKMKSKTKEENKNKDVKKSDKKKTLKRSVLDKVVQEIPKKKIKMSKKSQGSNKKIPAKQESQNVIEKSEKKKIKTAKKEGKTKKMHLKPKRLNSVTEVDASQHVSPHQKKVKKRKKVVST